MNEQPENSRLISGEGPVNSRTVKRREFGTVSKQALVHPEAIARAQRSQARSALGARLDQQVQTSFIPVHQRPQILQISSAILLASSAITGMLAWLQNSMIFTLIGCGVFAAGCVCMITWKRRQSTRQHSLGASMPPPIFDSKTLRVFDDALEVAAPELTESALASLRQLKVSMSSVAEHTARVDEHFTQDDRMFLVECLRRYIPDTLEAYLRVPKHQRGVMILPGEASADATLQMQLSLLQKEINTREKKIGRSAANDLLKQQRFLESKKTR